MKKEFEKPEIMEIDSAHGQVACTAGSIVTPETPDDHTDGGGCGGGGPLQ